MNIYRYGVLQLSLLLTAGALFCAGPVIADEVYGPINVLKAMPTPFGPPAQSDPDTAAALQMLGYGAGDFPRQAGAGMKMPIAPALGGLRGSSGSADLSSLTSSALSATPSNPIAMSSARSALPRRSLADRLVQSRLYLPGRLVIGRTAEFTIKGRPGYFVALAMADKDSGAKPIYGRSLRLGADRKLVSLGQIPEDGILHLIIDTPIEGDLIGLPLFFEAAIWSKPDYSDLEIASPITSEGEAGAKNAVIVAAEPNSKRGLQFVPESKMPSAEIANPSYGVGSGRP